MKGKDLIKIIKENNWEDTYIFIGTEGYCKPLKEIEPLFPKLWSTNEIVLRDTCEIEKDDRFFEMFYETYMHIIPLEEVLRDPSGVFVLYCDGTEGQLDDNVSEDKILELYDQGCMFGVEKNEIEI